MNTIKKTLGALLLLLATSVSANVINFDFNNPGSSYNANSLSVTNSGVTVDITAWTIENNGLGVISGKTQVTGDSDHGIYFYSSDRLGIETGASDDNNIDGANVGATDDFDEGLQFTFSEVVSLSFVDFDNWGSSSDDFNLTVDGITLMVDFGTNDSNVYGYNDNDSLSSTYSGSSSYFDFNNIVGTEFLFWADSDNDEFNIDSMKVSKIPEPSIIALFGLGMMGIAFSRRKIKK